MLADTQTAWQRVSLSPPSGALPGPTDGTFTMLRFACDSDQLDALVACPIMFTYADLVRDRGHLHALRARFPGSVLKLIDRGLGDPSATAEAVRVVDTEPGANGIAQAAQKLLAMVKEGRQFVTGYANRDEMPLLIQQTQSIGLSELEWWKWYATLDGTMRIAEHPDAMVQFANSQMAGAHIDLSAVWNGSYHPEAR